MTQMQSGEFPERFYELLRQAEVEDYAPPTAPKLEEAWRLADAHGDVPHGVLGRYFYVFAVAPMKPDRALVAFSWCLAHREEAEGLLPPGSLVQLYGIATGILRSYPDYSLEQIEETFQQMEEEYRELGLNMRDVWHHRLYACLGLGQKDEAAEYYSKWRMAAPNPHSCPSCDLGTAVLYHLQLEEYDRGIDLARPILDGVLFCDDGQPLMTLAAVLLPLLRMGEVKAARQYFEASLQELQTIGYAGIWATGRQLGYLALGGDADRAARHFERYASFGLLKGTPTDRYGFLLSCKLMARRLAGRADEVELRIPQACRLYEPEGRYDTAELVEWFDTELTALARRFDERNGNDEYTRIAGLFDDLYDDLR